MWDEIRSGFKTQKKRCRWRKEKKEKREKPHVLNVGGGKNNCKLLITRQACVRPSDHLLTQKMRALECGRAHNFSACVTSEERKAKQGGGWMEGKGTEVLLARRRRRRKRRWRNRSRRRGRRKWRRMPDGFGLALKDGGGRKAGASPVSTSWVTEHDLSHLEPITQFLTTSWNTSTHFLRPKSRGSHKSRPGVLEFLLIFFMSHPKLFPPCLPLEKEFLKKTFPKATFMESKA